MKNDHDSLPFGHIYVHFGKNFGYVLDFDRWYSVAISN